jgi:hypothetical protein
LPDGTPSHGGAVEVVMLQGDDFLSAGTDGYIRWWNFDEVDQAEPDEGLEY